MSEDNARSWAHSSRFPDARNITFSCLLNNGNVIFATRTRLYLRTDNLKSYQQITVKHADGRDFVPHTPVNPENPGWYFHALDGVHTGDVTGVEMLVWGNYCNVMGGAVPVNIFYSADQGQTVKVAYAFGQNPHYRDNGSPGGGATGTLLGDPNNPDITDDSQKAYLEFRRETVTDPRGNETVTIYNGYDQVLSTSAPEWLPSCFSLGEYDPRFQKAYQRNNPSTGRKLSRRRLEKLAWNTSENTT